MPRKDDGCAARVEEPPAAASGELDTDRPASQTPLELRDQSSLRTRVPYLPSTHRGSVRRAP